MFCIVFNSEYQLWISLRRRHCDISYKHYTWRHCRWKLPVNRFLWPKGLNANAVHTEMHPLYADECFTRPAMFGVRSLLIVEKVLMNNDRMKVHTKFEVRSFTRSW